MSKKAVKKRGEKVKKKKKRSKTATKVKNNILYNTVYLDHNSFVVFEF